MSDLIIPVRPEVLPQVQASRQLQDELVEAATSFRAFLRHWRFMDQETMTPRQLGDVLWPGQDGFVTAMEEHDWVYALKARKLGFTTLGCAYDGWVLRFRSPNGRVHLFSRRDDAAKSLLRAVKYGLDHLPDYMRLPYDGKPKVDRIVLYAGPDDKRTAQAFPADEDTAVEETCNHGHVDEWARMGNPERVWQAIEPTMAGTCHIITTGLGPENYSALYWRKSLSGMTQHHPFFVGALTRRGRDEVWLAQKKSSMSEKQFRQEYAMTWQDALYGGGDFTFTPSYLDICGHGGGFEPAEYGHQYVIAWDIGRHADASVMTVIDTTITPVQVVQYKRLKEVPYPIQQRMIERQWVEYGGPHDCQLRVEKNAAGEAVIENLDIPERYLYKKHGAPTDVAFATTGQSKARIIENLVHGFESHGLEYSATQWPQLDAELRGYQIPDDNVVQDSVMSLAIGYDGVVAGTIGRGRARRIISW